MDIDPERNKDPPPIAVDDAATPTPPVPAARRRRMNRTADQLASENVDTVRQEQRQVRESSSSTCTSSIVKRTEFVKTTKSTTTELREESSSSTSSSQHYVQEKSNSRPETPSGTGHNLRQKIAKYEKVWSSGGGMKRASDQSPDEWPHDISYVYDNDDDDDNAFEIDVYEIEKRLREERQRGLAEAEAAKLAFQQVQLRATPQTTTPPRRVEIKEEHTASPFNVTLKTSTKLSAGPQIERLADEEDLSASPFNVTLRTTRRVKKENSSKDCMAQSSPFNVTLRATTTASRTPVNPNDPKMASAEFLANEKTVREVQSVDGVCTIVTSSMTSDGRSHEEKIFRHGEGYISPRDSPQRNMRNFFEEREGSMPRSVSSYSSGRSSVTPPRSIDMTAGGRRILIKLEDEFESIADDEDNDETDSVKARIRKFQQRTAVDGSGVNMGVDSGVAMGTYGNIDITVGSNPRRRFNENFYHHEQQQQTQMDIDERESVEKQVTVETGQQQKLQQQEKIPWQTTTRITTTTTSATKAIEKSSITESRQLLGSSTEESRHIATLSTEEPISSKRIVGTKSSNALASGKSLTTSKVHISGGVVAENPLTSDNTDDSDTEGVLASNLVIVPTTTETTIRQQQQPDQKSASASALTNSALCKGLSSYQIQQQQSANNEYQEFQSTMAAKSFTRSNSQYDSHIKELRGKYLQL